MPKIVPHRRRGIDRNETRLEWKDKRKTVEYDALPFQVVERLGGEPTEGGWRNKLIWGENKLVMGSLSEEYRGKVDLIYIDPPFATGKNFTARLVVGEQEVSKQASIIEQRVYEDTWGVGLDSYLQMIYDRLVLMRDLLAEDGSIYVHLDWRVGHYVKLLLDEVFGKDCFRNEIIWHYKLGMKAKSRKFHSHHDNLMWYVKNPSAFKFTEIRIPLEKPIRRPRVKFDSKTKRAHQMHDEEGRPLYHISTDELVGSVWHIRNIAPLSKERVGFDTQKPGALVRRILEAHTDQGDLVADFFCGSGTTGAVAERVGRRWIMADLSRFAIHVTRKRMLDNPDCDAFEVLTLARYPRQYFIGEVPGREQAEREEQYLTFVIQLYRASRLEGHETLHGIKKGRYVHVASTEAPVTEDEVARFVSEMKDVGGVAGDVLYWEYEMGLPEAIQEINETEKVDVKLLRIPQEVMQVKDPVKEQVTFFEMPLLEFEITPVQDRPRTIQVALTNFVIFDTEAIPLDVRESLTAFSDLIDYWAVDFKYDGKAGFTNGWQSYRTRRSPTLEKECRNTYEQAGEYSVAVKVIDVFGNDITKVQRVKVK